MISPRGVGDNDASLLGLLYCKNGGGLGLLADRPTRLSHVFDSFDVREVSDRSQDSFVYPHHGQRVLKCRTSSVVPEKVCNIV